tara:strand:+ start:3248 stop:5212 length:1965 start_codon:yes stop_codon:yes gene_type:complete
MRIESEAPPRSNISDENLGLSHGIYSKAGVRPGTRTKTVLVIDDDPSVIRLIEKSLQGSANVLHEFGAPEPDSLDLEGIDLVFLDYQMPVRNGIEVLAEIRADYPDLPIVFLTGFGSAELAEAAMEAGASEFLTKPAGPSAIRSSYARFVREPVAGVGGSRQTPEEVDGGIKSVGLKPDRPFQACGQSGAPLSGTLVRFSADTVVVEFSREMAIEAGGELSDLSFSFGRQRIWSGRGVVAVTTLLSPLLLHAEVVIPGMWSVDEEVPTGAEGSSSGTGRSVSLVPRDLIRDLQTEQSELPDEFRLASYELAGILKAVQQECLIFEGSEEVGLSELERLKPQQDFLEAISLKYAPAFWTVMKKFEASANKVTSPEGMRAAKAFARKVIFPMALCSPFLARVVEKPIGVPGDFGMLGQILGNPLEGNSLYDRLFNSWILGCGAADAYRYRVDLLYRESRLSIEQCRQEGRKAKILSIASGVAYEVQRYIENPIEGSQVDFTMVDFSEDTLEEARRQYGALGSLPDGVEISMHQSSVIDLANRSRGVAGSQSEGSYSPDSDYDVVYCTGLFDYLSDRLIVKVISYLHGLLAPGGKLIVSNYTTENPIKSWMTLVMDWQLIYRSEAAFGELVTRAVPNAPHVLEIDRGGVEVYAIVEK